MKALKRLVRIAAITGLCIGLAGAAQTTTTYSYGSTAGAFSNAYYTFGVPLHDSSDNQLELSIYEGSNAYTGAPYSRASFSGDSQWAGLTFNGAWWKMSGVTKAYPTYPTTYPPPCDGTACGTLIGSFSGTDPSSGKAVTINVNLEYLEFIGGSGRYSGVRYEIYGGTVTVTE